MPMENNAHNRSSPMRIEQLSVDNLREGVYCPRGLKRSEEVYAQLEAWLDGSILRGPDRA